MKHTRTGGLVALAIAGSMALSACGSNSNGSTAASTTSAAAAATSAAAAATSRAAAATSAAAGASSAPALRPVAAPLRLACVSGSLSGAGSSFQGPMQDQWAKDYARQVLRRQGRLPARRLRRRHPAVRRGHDPRLRRLRRADEDRRAGRRRQALRQPGLAPADHRRRHRRDLEPPRRHRPHLLGRHPRRHLPGQGRQVERRRDQGRQPLGHPAVDADLGRLPRRLLRHQRRLHRLPRGRVQEVDAGQRQDRPVARRHGRAEERRCRRTRSSRRRVPSPTSSRPSRPPTSCRWPRSRTARPGSP